ncbi:MAG: type 1 glutamine amidotransferase [Verrucomicrobiota bacterium]|nr:type 1 glutamine amidotransferase [Verrucomicrobiota bacterium]MDG1890945.1 type 1 glutamine amidotransferase [Verrucomicrobiota bacterium]
MRVKQLLLVDAVRWSADYMVNHPLREVSAWFSKTLPGNDACVLNVLNIEDNLDQALEGDLHGVIISGSPRDAWDHEESTINLLLFLQSCLTHRIPVLGVCFGHQILARFLKGEVKHHPEGLQLMNSRIELTTAGRKSPLFKGLKTQFNAISGHADYVEEIPPNCQWLARSKHTKVQAFQFQDLFFGVQFHPEFTGEIIKYLWTPRVEIWREKVPFNLRSRIQDLKDPDQTPLIIQNFVNHYAR